MSTGFYPVVNSVPLRLQTEYPSQNEGATSPAKKQLNNYVLYGIQLLCFSLGLMLVLHREADREQFSSVKREQQDDVTV